MLMLLSTVDVSPAMLDDAAHADCGTRIPRLRCAIFLLDVCCSLVKTSCNGRGRDCITTQARPRRNQREGQAPADLHLAHACAEDTIRYVGKILQAATTIMFEEQSRRRANTGVAKALGGKDVVYWALLLASDVLKHPKGRGRILGNDVDDMDDASAMNQEVGEKPGASSRSDPGWARSPAVGNTGYAETRDSGSRKRALGNTASWKSTNLASLVRAMAAVPLERESGTAEVLLKWLDVAEVTTTGRGFSHLACTRADFHPGLSST